MHSYFRKNKKIIVWLIVITFIFGGALMGYGAYNFFKTGNNVPGQLPSMATVNKESVTYQEFYAIFRQYAQMLDGAPADMFIMYQYQTLKEVIDNKLLLQEAKKQKIKTTVTDEDVDKYINEFKANYGVSDEKIDELLKEAGITMAQWRGDIKEALYEPKTIENLLHKITGEINVTEQDIINEYEQAQVSAIFVNTKEDGSGKGKIEEALAKVKAGEDFAEIAKTYSEGLYNTTGGSLGYINRNVSGYPDILIEKAFALEKGQVSEIFEAEDGYYIIKTTEKKLAEGEEFEAQKEEIKNRIITLREAQIQSDWFEDLKAKAKIKILVPELAGYEALMSGEHEEAISKFKEAIKATPGNGAFYSYLAQAYKGLGQTDKAIETYQKAIEEATIDWEMYYDLALTYKDIDEKDKAVVNLQKASEEAGELKYAHDRIKGVFESLGYKDLALKEEAIIADIEAKEAEEAQKQAEALKAQDEAAAKKDNKESKETSETGDSSQKNDEK